MHKRIPGIALAILCLFAGGMYAMRHGAGFFVPESEAGAVRGETREDNYTQAFPSEAPERININTADAETLDKLPGPPKPRRSWNTGGPTAFSACRKT